MFIVCHAHFYTNIQSHRPPHNSFSRAAHCRNCVAAKSMIDDIMCRAQSYTKLQSHRPPHNSFSRAAHCRNCVAAKSMIKCSSCVVPNFTLKFIHTGHRTIPFACCTLQKLRCLIEHDQMFIMCRAQFYTKLQSHRPPHNSFSRAAHCRNCIAAKSMIDDIMCCALHPSGTIIAVGLHEKLQLFSIAQVIRFFTSSLLDCMKSCSCSALPRQTVLHAISMQGRGRQT